MKVTIEKLHEGAENEVIIRYSVLDEPLNNLLSFLETPPYKLFGKRNKEVHMLNPEKIFYVESENRKVYIHGADKTYESPKKLYELEEELAEFSFFRASKWMVLNINTIESVRPLFDGRFEALLRNKRKVFISRKYVPVLKKKLKLERSQ